MTPKARLLFLALVAALWVLLTAPSASAHASLRSSDPAAGSRVDSAPSTITVTFSEAVEPSLSSIAVIDSSGRPAQAGVASAVEGNPVALTAKLGRLERGIYTVQWRAFSAVDGHTTVGTFAFGFGESPTALPDDQAAGSATPAPSGVEMVGRWLFNLGVIVLAGGSLIMSTAFSRPPASNRRFLLGALAVAVAGLALLAAAQRAAAGVGWKQLFGVFVGQAIALRAGALLLAGVAILFAGTAGGRSRIMLAIASVFGFAAMLAHVAAGHAAASANPLAAVGSQWTHFAAAGVWIGGLAALLNGVRGAADEAKGRAVRRFSLAAGVALILVGASGVVRAVDSLNGWKDLIETPYGIAVTVKASLWVVLASLGAVNRFRNVPQAFRDLKGLRRVGGLELGIAVFVIAAAAVLASLPPPVSLSSERQPSAVSVSGSDLAESIRARLEVSPGASGPNRFVLELKDFDTRESVAAVQVVLRFISVDDPDAPESTLELQSTGPGRYEGQGPNMATPGRWKVVAVVQETADATEIPMQVATRCDTQAQVAEGQPTIYTMRLPGGGSAQGYVDPGVAGPNEVHLTFFDANGQELPMAEILMRQSRGLDPPSNLALRKLSPGHVVADVELGVGRYRYDFQATGADSAASCFVATIGEPRD